MNYLVVHTATELCAAAIFKEGSVYESSFNEPRVHAKKILPMIDGLCKESGLTMHDIDYFVVTQGPGSFTGIRIGLSIMKAFALVYAKPLLTLSTLELYAQSALLSFEVDSVCVAIDAKMNEVHCSEYMIEQDELKAQSSIETMTLEQASIWLKNRRPCIGVGCGFANYFDAWSECVEKIKFDFKPSLSDLGNLLLKKSLLNNKNSDVKALYCREKIV